MTHERDAEELVVQDEMDEETLRIFEAIYERHRKAMERLAKL